MSDYIDNDTCEECGQPEGTGDASCDTCSTYRADIGVEREIDEAVFEREDLDYGEDDE